jgi:hypothetical protein
VKPDGQTADSLRAVVREVTGGAEYEWSAVPDPWRFVRETWQRLVAGLDALREQHPIVFVVVVGLSLVLLVAISIHLGYLTWMALRPRQAESVTGATVGLTVRDARWHRDQAARLEAEGRYVESLTHRFLALLRDLEARRVLTVSPAKTPAEYVGEARLEAGERDRLAGLVARLYRHVFGGAPATPGDLAEFDRAAASLIEHRAAT